MIKEAIKAEDKEYAKEVLVGKNFGNRSTGFNGTYTHQYTGLIGDLITHRILGREYPTYGEGIIAEDISINDKKVDVKSMARNFDMRDNWVHNFVGYQKDIPSDILLFVNLNKREEHVEICGWLPKQDFLDKAKFYEKGELRHRDDGTSFPTKAPLYEIEQHQLNQIDSVEDLKKIGA